MHLPGDLNPSEEEENSAAEGPHQRTDPSRKWFIWMVAIGVVALIGVFAARPVYRLVKEQRARSLLPRVQSELDAGNLTEAGKSIRLLLGLAPRDPSVLRLTASFCSRVGNPEGLNYWNMLLAQPEATRADRLAAVEFALTLNRLDVSQPHLQRILATNAMDREALRLLTRHFRLAGDSVSTRSSARNWLEAHPSDLEAEFTLGSVLLEAADAGSRSEGARLLWGLVAGGSEWSEPAATLLASSASLNRGESSLLLRMLREKPETRLAAERLRLRLDPESRNEIVGQVASSVTSESPLPELVPVVSWLAEAGALDEALSLLPVGRAATNAALLSVRVQILLERKQFKEVETLLQQSAESGGKARLIEYVAECFAAMKAKQQGQETDIGPHLDSALSAAGRDPRALAFVAGYSEYLGATRTAMNAHLRRLEWPPALLSSASEAFRLARLLGAEDSIHQAVRRLSDALPGDVGLKALEAYQAALLKASPATTREQLVELQRTHPDDMLFRASLALTELRAGRATEALALMEAVNIDWKSADPRWYAVYVAALSANQQREAARIHARQITLDKLTTSERLLLDAAR
jgi:hypothetical protein